MLISGALPDARAEDTVVERTLAGAQPVFDLIIPVATHHDRNADFTGRFGGNDIRPGPLDLLEQAHRQARDRLVGGPHLGGHAVVRGPHRVRRNLERLQEEAADGPRHDRGHDHHLGVVGARSQRVDLAAVTDQHLVATACSKSVIPLLSINCGLMISIETGISSIACLRFPALTTTVASSLVLVFKKIVIGPAALISSVSLTN